MSVCVWEGRREEERECVCERVCVYVCVRACVRACVRVFQAGNERTSKGAEGASESVQMNQMRYLFMFSVFTVYDY